MRSRQMALLISILMLIAALGGILARPDTAAANVAPAPSLATMIPEHFGDWRGERSEHVVNPQERQLLDKLYGETLSRIYVNSSGYMIMLSLAYGRDQRNDLTAHMPEVCYPALGFTLHKNESGELPTRFGNIAVRRLLTSRGAREEPVTYWFTFGAELIALNQAERRFRTRLMALRYAATGRIPDGLLFRVSSIDRDHVRARQIQDEFVNDLLRVLPPVERKRLSGLGDS
jgi:EpsI family protein